MASNDDATSPKMELTDAQKARIERNRQKALLLRQARLASRPYTLEKPVKTIAQPPPKIIDSGGGFLIEEEEAVSSSQQKVVHPRGAFLGSGSECQDCGKSFMESFLLDKFDLLVCDACRDADDKHKLITKSDAKTIYLLKDSDLSVREPPLKFVVKKNPHNERWGSMKLYLESQVSARALEVWESEEKMEQQREARNANREKLKQKRFDKKVKDLRKAVRSSLWRKDNGPHEHVFGEEQPTDEEDVYTKTCTECGYQMKFEKM